MMIISEQKTEAQKELNKLKEDFKKRTDELERIINGSGFNWDFGRKKFTVFGDGDINRNTGKYMINYSNTTNSEKYARQLAKIHSLNAILMQLAEHFNPKDWEPDWDDIRKAKYCLRFDHQEKVTLKIDNHFTQAPSIYFHPVIIEDVIEELENNREKWVHLVGWDS